MSDGEARQRVICELDSYLFWSKLSLEEQSAIVWSVASLIVNAYEEGAKDGQESCRHMIDPMRG